MHNHAPTLLLHDDEDGDDGDGDDDDGDDDDGDDDDGDDDDGYDGTKKQSKVCSGCFRACGQCPL